MKQKNKFATDVKKNGKPFFDPSVQYLKQKPGSGPHSFYRILPAELFKGTVLDLGSGGGRFHKHFERYGHKWIGLDIAKHKDVTVIADAHTLPFGNESFDCVFSNCALEHLRDPKLSVFEVHRVLKLGGLFVGNVAFMEPFHKSYFNMTHWGLEYILLSAGFNNLKIQPGYSLSSLVNKYVFMVNPRIFRISHKIVIFLMKIILSFIKCMAFGYARAKYGRRSGKYMEIYEYYDKKLPFVLAGSFFFWCNKDVGIKAKSIVRSSI